MLFQNICKKMRLGVSQYKRTKKILRNNSPMDVLVVEMGEVSKLRGIDLSQGRLGLNSNSLFTRTSMTYHKDHKIISVQSSYP